MILRAEQGSPALTVNLEKGGLSFTDVPCYRTKYGSEYAVDIQHLAGADGVDFVTFTSASTVRGFAAPTGGAVKGFLGVCIGEQTAAEARKHGYPVIVAREATIDALIEAILQAPPLERA